MKQWWLVVEEGEVDLCLENPGREVDMTLISSLRTMTRSHYFVANQLRLLLSSLAYVLMERLRALGLAGSEWARLQASTLRTKLLKVGAVITRNSRRIRVWLSSAFLITPCSRTLPQHCALRRRR